MKTLITGATGFIGRPLVARLSKLNHELVILSRNPESARAAVGVPCEVFPWEPVQGPPPAEAFRGVDNVIHLAGESVGEKRWTAAQKKKIFDSRVVGTRNLVEGIVRRKGKPLTVVCASAIGYYGDRGEEELHEVSAPGKGFLAEVCKEWEKEARHLPYGQARLVNLRTGIVLGNGGGAMKKLLPIFRNCAGGPIGGGQQWMSWIHLEDLVSLFQLAVENQAIEGALNGVSPNPVRNEEFTRVLGKVLQRPAFLRAPAFAMRLAMGEMSELVLGSQRVVPDKALAAGFKFRFPDLESALRNLFETPAEALRPVASHS